MHTTRLIVISLLLFLTACVTPMTEVPVAERITVREYVIDAPGRSKDEIFTATKIWLAETFASSKAVIEDADKEAGRIIGNGSMPYPCRGKCEWAGIWNLKFTIRVDMKDGKFKITYSNIQTSTHMGDWGSYQIKEDQPNIKLAFENLNQSLQTYVTKEKQKANW